MALALQINLKVHFYGPVLYKECASKDYRLPALTLEVTILSSYVIISLYIAQLVVVGTTYAHLISRRSYPVSLLG